MPEKMALNVQEAAELLGVSRPQLYTVIHTEDFPIFSIGRRRLISTEGLREWVRKRAEAKGGDE